MFVIIVDYMFLYLCAGLCHKNINQVPGEPFPTTPEDLQGFWDMVMLQVTQIDELFAELDELKANNWVIQVTTTIYACTLILIHIHGYIQLYYPRLRMYTFRQFTFSRQQF